MNKAFELFELACVALAPPHVAEAGGPDCLATVRQRRAERGLYVVSNEYCDATIFSSPAGNHAFRAWHDACHDACGGDFDLSGEIRTWRLQRDQLREWLKGEEATAFCEKVFRGRLQRLFMEEVASVQEAILHCEVLGQLAYYVARGTFPTDQRAFAECFLQDGDALSREF